MSNLGIYLLATNLRIYHATSMIIYSRCKIRLHLEQTIKSVSDTVF